MAGAWTRKEGKNPEGGLNAKGRASLRAEGRDIKPPVSRETAQKSEMAAARRRSFCARMEGMKAKLTVWQSSITRQVLTDENLIFNFKFIHSRGNEKV